MNRILAILICCMGLAGPVLGRDADAAMDRYFAIWADNARVTPETVARLYASHVVYYGKTMTARQVYRDKANYIRQWPDRRYKVTPGSVTRSCNAAETACTLFAVLSWEKSDPVTHEGRKGANTVTLSLVREAGALRIARESGSALAQSACRSTAQGLVCSTYR